jgi:large subunit ribosomal protein L17
MRHGNKVNHLGRTSEHRKALLKNLANSLIKHKRINTTLAKAKALRVYLEPLVTKSRDNTTHSRRVVFSYLQSKESIQELFGPIAIKIADRPGGYLRIIKTGFRKGDAADMALIEFVDYNEVYKMVETGDAKSKRKRTRRGGSGKVKAAEKANATSPVVEDELTEEVADTTVDEITSEEDSEAKEKEA